MKTALIRLDPVNYLISVGRFFLAGKSRSDFLLKSPFFYPRKCLSLSICPPMTSQQEEHFLSAMPCCRPLELPLRFHYINILPDTLSHITCNFYPWNTVVHLSQMECMAPAKESGKAGLNWWVSSPPNANIFKQLKQKVFSDCILGSLQEKVNSGMFWRDESWLD